MKIKFKAVAHSAAEKFVDTGSSDSFGPYDHTTAHQLMSALLRMADLRDIIDPDAKAVERKTANYLAQVFKKANIQVFDSLTAVVNGLEHQCGEMEKTVGYRAGDILRAIGLESVETHEWAAMGEYRNHKVALIYHAKYKDRKDIWLLMVDDLDHIASTHFGDLDVDQVKETLNMLVMIKEPTANIKPKVQAAPQAEGESNALAE